MAVDEIARLENIQVPAYQVEEQIQSLKDQATKEGTAANDMDDEQIRRKVESTLERRMVYDLLADAAILEVEYIDDEIFDEALMEKLAAESLERELAEDGKQLKDIVAPTAAKTAVDESTEEAYHLCHLAAVQGLADAFEYLAEICNDWDECIYWAKRALAAGHPPASPGSD